AGSTYYTASHGTSIGCTTTTGTIAPGTPLGTPNLWFDPCQFTLQPIGTLGNVARDSMRGPSFSNVDFSVIKDTSLKFREGASLEFRAEFFNIFNHPNFITPQLSGSNLGAE